MKREERYFNEFLQVWLEENRTGQAPSTYVKYRRMAGRYIAPYFSEIPLKEVDVLTLQEYRTHLLDAIEENRLSDGSVRCLLMIVNAVLERAAVLGLIPPGVRVSPCIRKKRHIVQVYSSEEQKKLEGYIQAHTDISTACIYLCLYTGLRLGELCALRWENINTEEGYIHVKQTVQRLAVFGRTGRTPQETEQGEENGALPRSELLLTEPKSSSSNRLVPVPSFLLPLLRRYREKSLPEAFILSGNAEIPMEPRTFQYQYKRCLARAGLRYLNFHSIRHTFATRCITVGMDPKTLSEILGHSDIKITLDYYFHSSFEFKKNQIERLRTIS